MNKKIFLYIKSLTFPNKSKFFSRNFALLTKHYQQKSYNLEVFKQNVPKEVEVEKKRKKENNNDHNDLESFLSTKDLDPKSKVYKGTLYEYETILCLQKNFGIITKRVGGKNDSGIDFRGRWKLPNDQKLMIVGQCKNYLTKCPPNSVRELEGVLSSETKDTLGILSSKSGFTKQAMKRFSGSSHPLILIHVVHDGKRCESFLWNKSCEKFLDGLEVTLRFANANGEFDIVSEDIIEQRPILLYNGRPFIPNYEEQYW